MAVIEVEAKTYTLDDLERDATFFVWEISTILPMRYGTPDWHEVDGIESGDELSAWYDEVPYEDR